MMFSETDSHQLQQQNVEELVKQKSLKFKDFTDVKITAIIPKQ
jgi:hypothetical protein